MTDALLTAMADAFWLGTGLEHAFPRPIERAIAARLPLTVVRLPAVGIRHVQRWFGERGRTAPLPHDERELMGLLFAERGHGVAFICGADPPEEQRLTVAHEAAHFLLDHVRPRQRVLAALGPSAGEVLDGRRPATVAERAVALLAHVRLGPHVHLLPRAGTDAGDDLSVAWAEARADALALELVAPRERVAWLVRRHPLYADLASDPAAREAMAGDLGSAFGLPPQAFRSLLRATAAAGRRMPALAAALAARRGERGSG